MDFREIRRLVNLVEKANIEEIEIEEEGKRIRVRKSSPPSEANMPITIPLSGPVTPPPASSIPPASHPAEPENKPENISPVESGPTINAPMVGTFYRAPTPDADAFVKTGDRVSPETVVCIIEAMKVMNEIKAGIEGVVTEALVENATAVEYGQPLFRVKAG